MWKTATARRPTERGRSIESINSIDPAGRGWVLARRHIIQHLYKHGNSTGVTIPRAHLFALGWGAGQFVISELVEDRRGIFIRLAEARDLDAPRAPRVETADVVAPR